MHCPHSPLHACTLLTDGVCTVCGTGGLWLVRAFQQVLHETAPFMAILGTLMLGFAVGIGIILHGNGGDFGDATHAVSERTSNPPPATRYALCFLSASLLSVSRRRTPSV
jgi:hypothetical protein